LQGLPYRLENLEGAGVLRRAGEQYRIAYMVLSVDDQRAISVASEPHGRSLAATFVAAAPRYQRLFARYPYVELRNDLGFVTVAGYTLNWDGLRIGTDRPGLVAATTTQINSTFDDILRLNGEIMLALRAGPKTAVQLQQQTGGSRCAFPKLSMYFWHPATFEKRTSSSATLQRCSC
jgi:hypothetical protein